MSTPTDKGELDQYLPMWPSGHLLLSHFQSQGLGDLFLSLKKPILGNKHALEPPPEKSQ